MFGQARTLLAAMAEYPNACVDKRAVWCGPWTVPPPGDDHWVVVTGAASGEI